MRHKTTGMRHKLNNLISQQIGFYGREYDNVRFPLPDPMLLPDQRNSLLLFLPKSPIFTPVRTISFPPSAAACRACSTMEAIVPVTTSPCGQKESYNMNRSNRIHPAPSRRNGYGLPREHEGENERISLVVVVIASPFHAFGGRPDIEVVLPSVSAPQHYIYSINLCHVAGLQLRITSGHYHKSTGMLLLPDDEWLAGIFYPPSPSPNRYLPHRYLLSLLCAQSDSCLTQDFTDS